MHLIHADRSKVLVSVACAAALAIAATTGRAETSTTQPAGATSAAASQPTTRPAFDFERIRALIWQMDHRDPVRAADATVEIKLLAKQGVPVWEALQPGDKTSARLLLTWLREHPGNIHHPSPLRMQWEMMNLYVENPMTGRIQLMGNKHLIDYAWLAREMIRDGDPYGYWALLDVALTALDVLRGPDHVTMPYVLPYLDRHLKQHFVRESLRDRREHKGFWSKMLTKPRPFVHPAYTDMPLKPIRPESPWRLKTTDLLAGLEGYRERLRELGLWLDPVWAGKYTAQTPTSEVLAALASEIFPARQHLYRLLRSRMGDPGVRKQVAEAVQQNHPRARLLQWILDTTEHMVYADAIRRIWPAELVQQCPGLLEDLLTGYRRQYFEGLTVLHQTLMYWPDRDWANRFAVALFKAAGEGKTELSISALMPVDNAYGVSALLDVYRSGNLSRIAEARLRKWMELASKSFRDECADRDLAETIVNVTTASQPVIDTSNEEWAKMLRKVYDEIWWEHNSRNFTWNDQKHRLEVPEAVLVHPDEQEVVEAYKERLRKAREAREKFRKQWLQQRGLRRR